MAKNPKFYPDVEPNPNFAALEAEVLQFWADHKVFEKSVENRPAANNSYVFYDGPPFANGLPHYGHLLTGYVKDAIARYQTMRGKRVERRFGWDCHGLPAEMGAEKELHITGRAAIIDYGIGKFNDYCRNNVMRYVADWEYYVTRQGRWVDFKNDYKTMDKNFMESVIWAFSELYKKGLVYEAFRVMPYSWAAETPLSNFETRMDNATREREDKAAYVKFKLKDKPSLTLLPQPDNDNWYVVAWTTTPWTLPSNLALAVGPDIEYSLIVTPAQAGVHATPPRDNAIPDMDSGLRRNDVLVVASFAAEKLAEQVKGEIIGVVKGRDLVGATYEPLFPYFKTAESLNGFKVWPADFVAEGDGTGIVHIAPAFGEDDFNLAKKNEFGNYLPEFNTPDFFTKHASGKFVVPVDGQGKFTNEIYDLPDLALKELIVVPDTRISLGSIQVSEEDQAQHIEAKDVAKYGLANMRILRWLKRHGKLVKDEPYKHNYPHCWRTDTPIIYRAMSSWYVAVTKFRDRAVELNQQITWIPEHVKNGQMGHMLATAPDWSISRNRFWGTPIPIWRSPSGKLIVPGSIEEIETLSGKKVADLHRPLIDSITFEKDGETYTRVEDVFDCWFESGSMPYAQMHYPFENKKRFEESFPADFITEYVGQTRGWFNTLIMLSTALFDKPPFTNCICHGVVIDADSGLKYSKRLKNYKDPDEVMKTFGADALRWMMLSSPVMRGADLAVDPEGKFIRDVVRLNIKPLWSAYNFFTLYANADGLQANMIPSSRRMPGSPAALQDQTSGDPGLRRDDGLNLLDRYILAKCKAAVEQVKASLDAYDTPGATEAITTFFDVLNNWYIRRSRARFWAEEVTPDKQAAYDTLYTVLVHMVTAAAPLLPFTAEMIYRGLTSHQLVTPSHDGVPLKLDAVVQRHDSLSVHLQDFPDVSAIADEADLVADMDRVRDACTAMASIRNAENIRNRQPLAKADYYGTNAERLAPFAQMMEEELNVKKIQFGGTIEGIAQYVLTINFPIAGKRLGGKMKAVGAAAKSGDWKKENGKVIVGGEPMEPGEYQLQLKPISSKGAASLSSNDAMVVLDLNITPELEAEGRARDLVRMIQQARKDAGLNVADRIALALDIPDDFQAAMETHRDYIAEQTLAVSIGKGAGNSDKQLTQELDGEQFVIGISKAA